MKNRKKWLLSFLHALFLLVLTAMWMNSPNSYGDEKVVIKWPALSIRLFSFTDKSVSKDKYLFIDLSHEKATIPSDDGTGNIAITDRKKLSDFFNIIKKNPSKVKFIFCDVLLKGQSDEDNALQQSIDGLDNLLFATQVNQKGIVEQSAFRLKQGLTDYQASDGDFIKFNLFQDKATRTLPIGMYSQLNDHQFDSYGPLHFDNGKLSLNYMIVDYKILFRQLFQTNGYHVSRLSDLLVVPADELVEKYLKGRIIIMGDFENDIHDTPFGPMPGSLIMLNTYLSLLDGKHLVSTIWIIYLLFAYTLLSKIILFHHSLSEKRKLKRFGIFIKSGIYLVVASLISYIIFGHHLQVLFVTLYINGIAICIQLLKKPFNWQNVKKAFTK